MLEVQLLGPVRVLVDGLPVAIDSARRRALLAALALRPNTTLSVESLCEGLWNEALPANPRGTLQSHISRLRSQLGADAVRLDHGGYRLVLGEPGTDVRVMEDLTRRATACKGSAPGEAARLFGNALSLWRGRALIEFADEPAFLADAVRLDEVHRSLVDDLHEAQLDAGQAAAVLASVERTAVSEPLRERSQLLLVRALHESGRSAEALRAADAYRRRLADETGLDPGRALHDLERRVLDSDRPVAPVVPPSGEHVEVAPPRLPASDSGHRASMGLPGARLPRTARLYGRDDEVLRLSKLLADERLVCVAGTGGVGKTRLVAEVLAAWQGHTAPVVVVELAGVRPGEVADAVAGVLGVRAGSNERFQAIVDFLSIDAMLLVLDNCEHVSVDVHDLVERILIECPEVSVLATSRSRLGVSGERVLGLGPLRAEHDDDPAIELFMDRTRRVDHNFDATAEDLVVIRKICHRLDGVPLSLELAAGRVGALGAAALLERLDNALDILAAPVLGAERRHASLGAVVEWSYRLLDQDARRLLDVLSIFAGRFDLGAAERVAAGVSRCSVAVGLGRLVDASLIVVDRRADGARYRLLEAVRQYGARRRAAWDRERQTDAAHAAWVVSRLDEAVQQLAGPVEHRATAFLTDHRDDARAAARHLLHPGGSVEELSALAAAVADLCLYRPDAEWLRFLRTAAERDVDGEAGDLLHAAASRACFLLGDFAAVDTLARPIAERTTNGRVSHLATHSLGARALYVGELENAEHWWRFTLDDPTAPTAWRLDALGGVAVAHCYRGDLLAARALLDEYRALGEALESDTYGAFADYLEGLVALVVEEPDRAVPFLEAAATRAARSGARLIQGLALTALVTALLRIGEAVRAAAHLRELIELLRRSATWPQLWTALRLAAEILMDAGRENSAVLLLSAADNDPSAPAVRRAEASRQAALSAELRARLGDAAVETIETRARATPRSRVLAKALHALGELAPD